MDAAPLVCKCACCTADSLPSRAALHGPACSKPIPHLPSSTLSHPSVQGAVALPPTELDTWDVEDDIVLSELALERHLAMCEVRKQTGIA